MQNERPAARTLVFDWSLWYILSVGDECMTENPIKHALHAIHTMDHSKEAALARLQRAGILTKSGKMTALYRRCIAAQTAKK